MWGKQLIRLVGQYFGCHKTHHFKPKLTCAADRANKIELLMLVLNFVVNSRLKNTHDISVEPMECFNEDA